MLVSWEWLTEYVELDCTPDELATRFALSGLNHEATERHGDDYVIDLEVTSNRGDCLGHIGIAREAAVLLGKKLSIPKIELAASQIPTDSVLRVENRFPEACALYSARVIQNVKVGPSPAWLVRRLEAIGVRSINNIVDATNYVMMECGQPLHAFDLKHIAGKQISVRPANPKEVFTAIDHRQYSLDPSMAVIADANRALALAGIMGGADSEVNAATRDIVIEAADFLPMPIRHAARSLKLHSPSSFRFERRVDPNGVDWASRRCCQLILELAGGSLCRDAVATQRAEIKIPTFSVRHSKVGQLLGIEVPWKKCTEILRDLGCSVVSADTLTATLQPPSWRHDLTREVDAIEEIARVYGYDQIPENVPVPITPSARRAKDLMLDKVRDLANASGLDEALTPSIVNSTADGLVSFWTESPALHTLAPLLEGATHLRRSLIGSLLQVKLFNQSLSNSDAQLFEIATVYLPSATGDLPAEQLLLGIVGDMSVRHVRGLLESILKRTAKTTEFGVSEISFSQLEPHSGIQFLIDGKPIGWMGQLAGSVADSWKLDGAITLAELNLSQLELHVELIPQLVALNPFPQVRRDLNMIVDEAVRWSSLAQTIMKAGGTLLVDCLYRETYRDYKKDGQGKKRILFSLSLQSSSQTMTSEQADDVVRQVVAGCQRELGAQLLA